MVTTGTEHQKRDEESKSIGLDKIENKHSGAEVGQHTGIS
jgi:hypothetical protein